ncbi:class I SAM-dependent RNA methyltransferase [Actinomarinicola tropica]|uniref:TRAM domain-containing protein n=1 Tax=Actinomarinicola tropica TaxID=2789776 RepID=A0A5Q2RFY9_9ACTN|nr:TRAM domain-containing protein [Actinomarinicola tropica]QGG95749.1 TRAM domain-containing protein [Actinomarinicola tropica]
MAADPIELLVERTAVGGDGVARDASGRVVFVEGALPGERVLARIRSEKDRFAKAVAVEVLDSAPARIVPVCPHVGDGCGGCALAHVAVDAQRDLKVGMVVEALERIGRLTDPVVEPGPWLAPTGFRTTVRAGVLDGRPALRALHGHDLIALDSCRVAHPLVEEVLAHGRFPGAREVTVRAGARTGERIALVDPSASADVVAPSDVVVVGADDLASGRRLWFHEEVHGVRLRVSAESFFQSRADGAEALVDLVATVTSDVAPDATMADLYCGVGLFAATVGRGRRTVAVERSRSSIADAKVNLRDQDATVVRAGVERWRPSPVALVVADPPRNGLAKGGVQVVAATGASHLALVSCDAGSLGRDARLLTEAGWQHEGSTLVDLFPDTPHVEVVSRFVRRPPT